MSCFGWDLVTRRRITERGAWLLCDACNEDSTMCPTGREAIILARAYGWVRVRRYVLGS